MIETGGWLSGRQVPIHPSAIRNTDHDGKTISIRLNRRDPMKFISELEERELHTH